MTRLITVKLLHGLKVELEGMNFYKLMLDIDFIVGDNAYMVYPKSSDCIRLQLETTPLTQEDLENPW